MSHTYRYWHFPIDGYFAVIGAYYVLRLTTGYWLWPIALMSNFLQFALPIAIPILALVLAAQQKRRAIIASVLTTLWIALYGLPIIARLTPKDTCITCQPVTVMTYNVGAGLADPAAVSAYLRESRADLIGLQEVTDAQSAVLNSQLGEIYPYQAYSGEPNQLGFLSKYPLEAVEEYFGRFEYNAKYMQFTVNVHDRLLTVVVTRLKPPRLGLYPSKGFGYVTWPTADDLVHIADLAAPAIVLIDMNASTQSENYLKLTQSGLLDAYHVAGSGNASTFPARTDGWYDLPSFTPPLLRIDYVLVTQEIAVLNAKTGTGSGSDHLPVFADLLLP